METLTSAESVWIDVVYPTADDIEKIATLAGLEVAFLKASLGRRGPTRIRLHDGTAVMLPLLRWEESLEPSSLLAVVKGNMLLTLRDASLNPIVSNVEDAIKTHVKAGRGIDHYYLFYRLVNEIVVSNFHALKTLRDSVEELEITSLRDVQRNIIPMISGIRKKNARFRDVLTAERHLLDYLRDTTLPLAPSDLHRRTLSEAWNELGNQLSNVDSLSSALVTTISMRDLEISTRLTKIITFLTVIATVLLLPNTIATIFGIPSFPLAADSTPFTIGQAKIFPWFLIIIAIIVSTLLPLVWLVRKGWMRL
ncbi:MAG: magnesium transporter CorA family protein [Candidatus Bathyarchaeia archaeon]